MKLQTCCRTSNLEFAGTKLVSSITIAGDLGASEGLVRRKVSVDDRENDLKPGALSPEKFPTHKIGLRKLC